MLRPECHKSYRNQAASEIMQEINGSLGDLIELESFC